MKRIALIVLFLGAALAHAGEKGDKKAIAYLQKLQTNTGGFLSQAPAPNIRIAPTLKATSSAVRTLHYLGGDVPNKDGASKFVESCYHADSGGFSDMPKGTPDVYTTAVGLMAVMELKLPADKYQPGAVKFMSEKAKGFEEIRIVAAGLESVKATTPKNQEWLKVISAMRNDDGTFGKGASKARATGGTVVALMRLGNNVKGDEAKRVLDVLNAGQRKDGGWGNEKDEKNSDLETTYRVMRCYMMLKATPGNVDGLRAFIARCRNEDGGYGVTPGQTSTVGGTYFAAIVLHWLKDSK
jgi:prenyltransferase beta subunit